jgi:hypothetical protein
MTQISYWPAAKQMDISPGLEPYFEYTLILCLPLCSYCGTEQAFESEAPACSDEWYRDMAVAIREAGWVIPELQLAACAACAASNGLRHDPHAVTRNLRGA